MVVSRRACPYRRGLNSNNPFRGLNRSSSGEIIEDEIHVLFYDFNFDPDNDEHLEPVRRYLADLRQTLVEALHEDDLWIVCHTVTRFT
jgi:hypothetical protein